MKDKTNSSYAVITGASKGLGKAFAFELARLGRNIVLVSLPDQRLQNVVAAIKGTYDVEVAYFETDFVCSDNIMVLCEWLNSNFNIDILINNAGVGGTTRFTDVNVNYIETMIQVNVTATVILTHQLLSNLKRQACSYILNVSSIAAFSPVGYKTVYPASKVFVHYFTRGLRAELKDSSVSVSVVHPGPMATNPEIEARIEKQGFIAKLTLLKPEKVARFAICRLLKKDSVIVLSHFTWVVSKLLPEWLTLYLMTRIVKREMKTQLA
ncbi:MULTISPECIES: SDR family NAD(P)-dependent oxidoreductase [unclassified Carboxylicivirga]|uniref:SDR family NAD(P)-dependent oxidoreductase n=1 Tax=Carboxylicivirga TaxID=1628153 RepID=UPI003D335106